MAKNKKQQQQKKKRLTIEEKIRRSKEKQKIWLDNGDATTYRSGYIIHTQFASSGRSKRKGNKEVSHWKPSTITDGATAHHGGGPLINTQKRDMDMGKSFQLKTHKKRRKK